MDIARAQFLKLKSTTRWLVSLLVVAAIALGMAISVVSLFGQVESSQETVASLANLSRLGGDQMVSLVALIESKSFNRSVLLAITAAKTKLLHDEVSVEEQSPQLVTNASTTFLKNYESMVFVGVSLVRSGNLVQATKWALGPLSNQYRELESKTAMTARQQQQIAKDTSLVADIETLAMMVFAALMTTLLFRKFSSVKLESELTAEREREHAQARFASLIENLSDVIVVLNSEMNIVYLTPSWERTLGWPVEMWLGQKFVDVVVRDDQLLLMAELSACTKEGSTTLTTKWHHIDGTYRSMESLARNLISDPVVGAIVLNARDVSDRHQLELQLAHSAFYDSLTDLPNRVLFSERLSSALRQSTKDQATIAVLCIDLDDFKVVNDTMGHAAGDELLRKVAQRLVKTVPSGETVARLRGAEFGVLLEIEYNASDAKSIAFKIIDELSGHYELSTGVTYITASVGQASSKPNIHPEELLKQADIAMYSAKQQDRYRFASFDFKMQKEILDKITLRTELRQVVKENQLVVLYQPVVDLKEAKLEGVEALVRWNHPERGLVSPVIFIPIAEESGLIVELGRFVQISACRQLALWNRVLGKRSMTLNINLSMHELLEPSLVSQIEGVINETGINPSQLTLELTETHVMSQVDVVKEKLHLLRNLGVKVAIDDFGTGYSSLSYLENLPVDALKIDKSFTDHLLKDEAPATLKTILKLGQELDLKVVAEGIEEQQQVESLLALGCTYGQGFYFARPVDAQAIDALIVRGGSLLRKDSQESERFRMKNNAIFGAESLNANKTKNKSHG